MNFRERFGTLTVGEVRALNEAARRTCEFELTSETEAMGG